MAVSHLEVDATEPFERGRQRGRQVRERLQSTWSLYQRLFGATADYAGRPAVDVPGVAEACLEQIAAWSPPLVRELEGLAAETGLGIVDIIGLNARTEVLAAARGVGVTECSTLVQREGPGGTALGAQTWDWHHDLADGWHLQTVRGDDHTFVGLSEHGMLAKIGINSAGLGVHFNLLRHASDRVDGYDGQSAPRGGIPVHLLAREVLGRAGTVDEAIEILRSAPLAASSVLTVLTPDQAACVEVCPDGVGVVTDSEGWLVHANHFLDPDLAEGERVTLDVTTTFERQDLLEARVKAVAEPQGPEGLVSVLNAHEEDGVAVCRHLDETAPFGFRSATLATVTLDPAQRVAAISAWGPCRRTDVVTLRAER